MRVRAMIERAELYKKMLEDFETAQHELKKILTDEWVFEVLEKKHEEIRKELEFFLDSDAGEL